MKPYYTAEPFGTAKYRLGEGPFWDERTGAVSFVDIIAGSFFIMNTKGEIKEISLEQMVGAAVPASIPGDYLLAARDGLYFYSKETITKIEDLSDEYGEIHRSNDAKADPRGRLFFGSIICADGYPDGGKLYCYENGKTSVLLENTGLANGMAWGRDRKSFFFSDSSQKSVFRYDYDSASGRITGGRKIFEINNGIPDGMCIDSEDRLWVAIWGGRRIECHDSVSGKLLSTISVEAENVTSCCFLSDSILLITTSGEDLSGEFDGCLFTCRVDASGAGTDYCKI